MQGDFQDILPIVESKRPPSTDSLVRSSGNDLTNAFSLGARYHAIPIVDSGSLRITYGGMSSVTKSTVSPLQDQLFPDAAVIQMWEGKVLGIDRAKSVMEVLLEAKFGNIPPHTGDIELQWVSPQDLELASIGAIFYLTLFKRTKRGSIENAQELRFRRLPTWSRDQLAQVKRDADMLRSKMKARPAAND